MRGAEGSGSLRNGQRRRRSRAGAQLPVSHLTKTFPSHKLLCTFPTKGTTNFSSGLFTSQRAVTPHPPPPAAPSREPRSSLGPAPRGVRECPSGPASPEGQGPRRGARGPAARAVLRGVPPQTLTEPGRAKSAPRSPDDEPHRGSGGGRTPTGAPPAAGSPQPWGRHCPPIGPLPPHCSPLPLTALRSRGGLW